MALNKPKDSGQCDRLPCPSCGEMDGVPLVWGEPDKDTWEAFLRGEVVLAGCVIEPNGDAVPDYACRRCCHRWRLQ